MQNQPSNLTINSDEETCGAALVLLFSPAAGGYIANFQ